MLQRFGGKLEGTSTWQTCSCSVITKFTLKKQVMKKWTGLNWLSIALCIIRNTDILLRRILRFCLLGCDAVYLVRYQMFGGPCCFPRHVTLKLLHLLIKLHGVISRKKILQNFHRPTHQILCPAEHAVEKNSIRNISSKLYKNAST